MLSLSSLLFLLNPFLASPSPLFHQLHHQLLLLQLLFLLPKRVVPLENDERRGHAKQYLQHHPHSVHPRPPQSVLPVPQLGCFRFGQPLCCGARNMSCKSMDDSSRPILSFVPRNDQPLREVRLGNYCIGRVILPNLVALNERGAQILHNLGQREHFLLNSGGGRRKKVANNFYEREETVIKFGHEAQIRERMGPEQREMGDDGEGRRQSPVVRYSLLSRYLPLRIVKRRIRVEKKRTEERTEEEKEEWEEEEGGTAVGKEEAAGQWAAVSEPWPLQILTESGVDCFCDELCAEYGDCCSNYAQACPPADCEVSRWSDWTECLADDGNCGVGTRERRRAVVRERANAGRNAFVNAFPFSEPTTVALLLDYHFANARRALPITFLKRKNQTTENDGQSSKTETHLIQKNKRKNDQYCVHYQIVWLNEHCTDQKQWHSKLSPGKVICAECQPEAQFHRSVPKCASDLEDGQSGFWKLIGPRYCYGIWHRLYSSAAPPPLGCACSKHFPLLTPFLMWGGASEEKGAAGTQTPRIGTLLMLEANSRLSRPITYNASYLGIY
ncbi:hypothetical protein niasHT_018167 [Heterodera trifolii]|uniref:SMB domain-containing protein n=1 Tax=Heterodera trifolii TaxID=157864 RepID=A0ABD2LK39_9BILA